MIINFGDFILENKLCDIIKESNLHASDEILFKLKDISSKSNIAKILYNLFDNQYYIDKSLPQNFINVTEDEDVISFLPDSRSTNSDDPFSTKGRGTIKIGRFVRALLNLKEMDRWIAYALRESDLDNYKHSEKDIEDFVNLYKSTKVDTSKKFKLVEGNDIKKYYDGDNYFSERGTLGSSCMRYDTCQDYFKLYTKNPSVCKLLVYINSDDKVLGRALIWKLSKSPCKESSTLMDRIYTMNDSDVSKFKKFADEQGWIYKKSLSNGNEENFMLVHKDKLIFGEMQVQLERSTFEEYPFLDTLLFLHKSKKLLSNVGFKNGYELSDTGGDCGKCHSCNGEGIKDNDCDDCYDGRLECESCDGDGTVECERCDGLGSHNDEKVKCDICKGTGKVIKKIRKGKCNNCDGMGEIPNKCERCDGDGRMECEECNGIGRNKCKKCKGTGTIKGKCDECVGILDDVIEDILTGQNPYTDFKEYIPIIKEYKNSLNIQK